MKIFKLFEGKLGKDKLGNHVVFNNDEPIYFIDFIKAITHKYDGRKARVNIELEIEEKKS